MPTIDRKPKPYRVIYRPRPESILHSKHFDTTAEAAKWLTDNGHPGRVEQFQFGGWREVIRV